MINQAGRSSCDRIFPVSLNMCADCEPSARCPVDFMPLPSRSTSADLPVVLDTARLLCSFLLPAAKETRSGCLCPGDCAPRGNVRDIAAMLAAAKILQTDQPRQTFFFDRSHPAFRIRVQIRAPCWQSKRIHSSRPDQFPKRFAELRVTVVQQIAAAPQASPLLHSHVSRLLLHPLLIRVRRESCQPHLATLLVDEEQHIVGSQPLSVPSG